MALSTNPTKTRGIEKAWVRDINRRWARFTRETMIELRSVSNRDNIIGNALEADPEQLRAFMVFFQQKIDELLKGDWQEQYQRRAYSLAIDRSMAALRKQGASSAITKQDEELAAKIRTFTATSTLGTVGLESIILPIHQEALEFLFTRSFDALDGLTDDLRSQTRSILFDGVKEGKGIREISKEIKDRIAVSRSRAKLIAQTETTQAFQRGTIAQTELASEFTGEDIDLRWDTRRDSKVRPLHVSFHGDIMTTKEASVKINISPFNCRCALSPVIEEADTPALREQLAKEREQLRALQKKSK